MKKFLVSLFLLLLITSCKTSSNLTGEYVTNNIQYTFNMNNHSYIQKYNNGKFSKGKFKTIMLNSEKTLIVCNDMVFKRTDGILKEMNNCRDSIAIGVFDGYKNAGATIFEITLKDGNLLFRKTYANLLQETDGEGFLIKK